MTTNNMETLKAAIQELNILTENNADFIAVTSQQKTVADMIASINNTKQTDHITELFTNNKDTLVLVDKFVAAQYIKTVTLAKDSKTKEYIIDDGSRQVNFLSLVQIANNTIKTY